METIDTMITQVLRHHRAGRKDFESLVGKLQHATMGLPTKQGLIAPLYQCLKASPDNPVIYIHPDSPQHTALEDCRTIIKVMASRPTHCKQLIPGYPAYVGYCDACKWGAGGVWISGDSDLPPLVWRLAWPPEIVAAFHDEPGGYLTINDLEMAGLVLHYLLLEQLVPLKHRHTAIWCDNTSAVSWAATMCSKRSAVGQQLACALCLCITQSQASPLAPFSIAGIRNPMADLASRSFRHTGAHGNYKLDDAQFANKFNSDFPLTQGATWQHYRHRRRLSRLVCDTLLRKPHRLGSWLRPAKCMLDIGITGPTTSAPWAWKQISPGPMDLVQDSQSKPATSAPLPREYEKEEQEEAIRSALAAFATRWQPSPRASVWTTTGTTPCSENHGATANP